MDYDIILMQETFLLQNRLAGATRQASGLGFFSSFIPACGTSGGLAILCNCLAAPQQRMEEGTHWEAGRWPIISCPTKVAYTSIMCMDTLPTTSKLLRRIRRCCWRSWAPLPAC
eukprot:2725114-Amphidinium_carterae.1